MALQFTTTLMFLAQQFTTTFMFCVIMPPKKRMPQDVFIAAGEKSRATYFAEAASGP
jgi:hypothetical protein